MKALTLHREWSHAVQCLGKNVENRDFRIATGTVLAIHAGKNVGDSPSRPATKRGCDELFEAARRSDIALEFEVQKRFYTGRLRRAGSGEEWREPEQSAIVAVSVVTRILEPGRDHMSAFPWWNGDCFGWLLATTALRHPIRKVKGRQGLWTYPHDRTLTDRLVLSRGFWVRPKVDARKSWVLTVREAMASRVNFRARGEQVRIWSAHLGRALTNEEVLRYEELERDLDNRNRLHRAEVLERHEGVR